MMSQDNKQLHLNKPQLKTWLIGAKETYCVMGRGTGKTQGIIAPASQRNIFAMPRSTGVFLGTTYQQLLLRTLPPVIAGWEMMGYKNGVHFFLGKKPPASWKWKSARMGPVSYDHYIPWINGSGIHLVSQDRPGTANGISIDWIAADEVKFLNKKRLDEELMPANRGFEQYYGECPWHHSLLYCTDMPTSSKAKWIFDAQQQMDPQQIDLILSVHVAISQLQEKLKKASPSNSIKIMREIARYNTSLAYLRKQCVYYAEASSLDNIEVLGVDYIKQMKRVLPDIIFQTAILNRKLLQVEDGFYPYLDEDIHCYDRYDYSLLDNMDYDLSKLSGINDCRADADVKKDMPLNIAMDYNASITWVVTAQDYANTWHCLSGLYVKHPERLKDAVNQWCDYYAPHPYRMVNYYYDHTAVSTDASRSLSFADEVQSILVKRGWRVNMIYMGQAPSHHSQYIFWGYALKGDDPRLPAFRFNRTNCKYVLVSMQQTQVKQGRNGFEKDKSPEKNPNIPQEEAPHGSDAVGTLAWGMYRARLESRSDFIDIMIR